MSDPQPWWDTVNWLDVVLTSGLLTTLLSIFVKWRNDKKKMPLERAQVESGIAQENVTSAMSISAEYREQLRIVKESMKEEYERQKNRHEDELKSIRRDHTNALNTLKNRLDNLEDSNGSLQTKVHRLEEDDRQSKEELVKQHGRIGKLESKLTSARDTVLQLVNYIKNNPNGSGEIPTVDYTIFDV